MAAIDAIAATHPHAMAVVAIWVPSVGCRVHLGGMNLNAEQAQNLLHVAVARLALEGEHLQHVPFDTETKS